MTRRGEYAGVNYYEFDFTGLIERVAAEEQIINRQILSEESAEADMQAKAQAMGQLVLHANMELELNGYLGKHARLGPSALKPKLEQQPDMHVLIADGEGKDDDEIMLTKEDEPATGTYQGLAILREHFGEEVPELSRPQICHRVCILSRSVSNTYVEQSTQLYAYLPIDKDEIDILRPAVMTLQNQRWLKGVARSLLDPSVTDLSFHDLDAAFRQIINAKHSVVPTIKNLDWLYDQVEEVTALRGKYIGLVTREFLLQAGEKTVYMGGALSQLEGTMLGLCSIPEYDFDAEKKEALELEGTQQLALCMEIDKDGLKALAKIPIKALATEEAE